MKLLTPKTLFNTPQLEGQDDFLTKCAGQIDELKKHVCYDDFPAFSLYETDDQVEAGATAHSDFVVIDLTSLMQIWNIKSKHDDSKHHLHLVLMNPFVDKASHYMSAFGWRFFVVDWGYEHIVRHTTQIIKGKDLAYLDHSGMSGTLRNALYMINEVAYDRTYPNKYLDGNAANGNWPKGQTELKAAVYQGVAAPTMLPLFEWEGEEYAYDDTESVTLMTCLLLAKVAAELVATYDEFDLGDMHKLGQDLLDLLPDFDWDNQPNYERNFSLQLSDGDDTLTLANSYRLNKEQMKGFLTIPRLLAPSSKRKLVKILDNLKNGFPLLDAMNMDKPALWHNDNALVKNFTNYLSLMPFLLQYDLTHSLSNLTLSRLKLWNHLNKAADDTYISVKRVREMVGVYIYVLMLGMSESFAQEAKNQHLPLPLGDIDSAMPGKFDIQLTFKIDGENGSAF